MCRFEYRILTRRTYSNDEPRGGSKMAFVHNWPKYRSEEFIPTALQLYQQVTVDCRSLQFSHSAHARGASKRVGVSTAKRSSSLAELMARLSLVVSYVGRVV